MEIVVLSAVLSFVFSVLAYIPYVQSVLNSKARPTLSVWISWGLMDATVLAGMIAQKQIAWQMVAYVIGVGAVIIVSLYKRAALGWTRLDTICVGIVIIAMAGWAWTGNPDTGIVLSLIAAVVGSIPLIINTWKDPTHEPLFPWMLITIGGFFGILAITSWTIAGAATQIVFFVLQIFFVFLILRRYKLPREIA